MKLQGLLPLLLSTAHRARQARAGWERLPKRLSRGTGWAEPLWPRSPPLCRRLPRPSDLPAAAALPSLPSKQSSPAGVQRISKSPAAAGVPTTEVELWSGESHQQPYRAPMPCKPVPRPFGSHPPEAPPQERCSSLRSFPALAGQGRRRRGVEGGDSSLPHGCASIPHCTPAKLVRCSEEGMQ